MFLDDDFQLFFHRGTFQVEALNPACKRFILIIFPHFSQGQRDSHALSVNLTLLSLFAILHSPFSSGSFARHSAALAAYPLPGSAACQAS